MPADPQYNEQAILDALKDTRRGITPNRMRTLCSLVMMCAFDRKVEREFMAGLIDDVTMIGIDLSEMEKAGAMREFLLKLDPERDPQVLDAEVEKLIVGFMRKRANLADKLDKISQIPGSDTKLS